MSDLNKIFLAGFMGSGKTTLGKKIAKHLNKTFLDLDNEIEKQEGVAVEEIFSKEGEVNFRQIEKNVLRKFIASEEGFVMALGGGTPCFYNNMELINDSGISIYLKYNAGMLVSRLVNAKSVRPLLLNKTKMELRKYVENTLEQREKTYSECQYIIEGDNVGVEDVLKLFQKKE